MGKRSGFPRIERDNYQTWDPRALPPLLPHLKERTRFIEPCCGDLHLVRQLEAAGHVCRWSSDIMAREVTYTVSGVPVTRHVPGIDALKLGAKLEHADCIITNTPWRVDILHPMIEYFLKYNSAWLLLNAGWAHTKQSIPYMSFCSDIVAIGRLKWIPKSKYDAKDDCSWYRFSKDAEYTVFHPRQDISAKRAAKTSPAGHP